MACTGYAVSDVTIDTWAIVGNAQVALRTAQVAPSSDDKTFYVTLMLLVSCPGYLFTLVTPPKLWMIGNNQLLDSNNV